MPQSYYLINHTRKEFSLYSNKVSLHTVLSEALGWKDTDDIRIDSENRNEVTCLERLDTLRYTLAKLAS
jgi:hypothetical protein